MTVAAAGIAVKRHAEGEILPLRSFVAGDVMLAPWTGGTGTRHASAVLTIDLEAISRNYRLLAERVGPGVTCAGVVKADAYGLGADRVAPALYRAGCRTFFVAHLDEGLDLQTHLARDVTIYVLNGLPSGSERDCAEAGIIPVLNSREQLEAWSDQARQRGRILPAVVQVDSGMSRLGMSPREVADLDDKDASVLDIQVVMSHLACADTPEHPANAHQLTAFQMLAKRFPAARKSLANSSGIFLGRTYHHDLVRPGAALYGLNPNPAQCNPMLPVVRLTAQVIQTREIEADAHVGYGWTFRATQPTRLATLAIGYADGLHRAFCNGGAVYFRGRRLAVAGRVSMDSLTIDLGDLPPGMLARGSQVEIIGGHQSLDALAATAGTIGYEMLTSLGQRYERIYSDEIDVRWTARSGGSVR
ncbi:alanine racemase [Tardiphaga sp. P9-11]|uniref:alanine racemase n=1 Tax=Tardiphaga sp. P9-11 TaxID=2024614 RepID=UPI0032E35B91